MQDTAIEREYEELLAFMGFFATRCLQIPEDHPVHPGIVSRAVASQIGKSAALVGMQQAIYAAVEELADLSPEQLEKFDAELEGRGIVTLSELRARNEALHAAIRERGSLASEMEYYFVLHVLEETAPILDPEERARLEQMTREFEKGREH
jgi:hypothetical protein